MKLSRKVNKTSKTSKTKKNSFNSVYKFSNNLKNITNLKQGKRTDAVKKVWEYINKHNLKGSGKEILKYNGKTYKGGQVISCKTNLMKQFSNNKTKIAMTQIAQLISNNLVSN